MKLKFLALLAIGLNANALDLNNYTERLPGDGLVPVIHKNGYFSTDSGKLYLDRGNRFDLVYDLGNERLLDTDGTFALGYTASENGKFFVCHITECNDKRNYLAGHTSRTIGHTLQKNTTVFSGHGEALVMSRSGNNKYYRASIINVSSGSELDYFNIRPHIVESVINDEIYYFVASTTGITQEKNFKFLTADDGVFDVEMKVWDDELEQLNTLNIYTSNEDELNSVYPNGVVPIAISNPRIIGNDSVYKIVLGILNDNDSAGVYFNEVIVGDIKVELGRAKFLGNPVSYVSEEAIFGSSLTTSYPLFHKSGYFTFSKYIIDINNEFGRVEKLNFKLNDRDFYPNIYYSSDNEELSILERTSDNKGFKLFSLSTLCR
jgi:hypothetical protein